MPVGVSAGLPDNSDLDEVGQSSDPKKPARNFFERVSVGSR
jgi:hypothetical protein